MTTLDLNRLSLQERWFFDHLSASTFRFDRHPITELSSYRLFAAVCGALLLDPPPHPFTADERLAARIVGEELLTEAEIEEERGQWNHKFNQAFNILVRQNPFLGTYAYKGKEAMSRRSWNSNLIHLVAEYQACHQ